MTSTWRVHPGGEIPYALAQAYSDARQRILRSRRLRPYLEVILSDGYAADGDHLRWVITSPVPEIEDWAKQIEEDNKQ